MKHYEEMDFWTWESPIINGFAMGNCFNTSDQAKLACAKAFDEHFAAHT